MARLSPRISFGARPPVVRAPESIAELPDGSGHVCRCGGDTRRDRFFAPLDSERNLVRVAALGGT